MSAFFLLSLIFMGTIPNSWSESTFLTVLLPEDVVGRGLGEFQHWMVTNVSLDGVQFSSFVRVRHGHRLKFEPWTIAGSNWSQIWVNSVEGGLKIRLANVSIRARTSWSFRNTQGPGIVQHGSAEVKLMEAMLKIGPIREVPGLDDEETERMCDGSCQHRAFWDLCSLETGRNVFNVSTPLPSYITRDQADLEGDLVNKTVQDMNEAICSRFYDLWRRFVMEKLRNVTGISPESASGNLRIRFYLSQSPVIKGQTLKIFYSGKIHVGDRICVASDQFVDVPPYHFLANSGHNVIEYAFHVSLFESVLECLWQRYAERRLLINDTMLSESGRGFLIINEPNLERPSIGDMIPDVRRLFPETGAQLAVITEARRYPYLEVNERGMRLNFDLHVHLHAVLHDRTEYLATVQVEAVFGLKLRIENGILGIWDVDARIPVVKGIRESHVNVTVEEVTSALEVLQAEIGHRLIRSKVINLGVPIPRDTRWILANASVRFVEDHVIIVASQ